MGNMRRTIFNDLVKWAKSAQRKPLILNGARQVGKTWLLKELGKQEFTSTAYVSFDNNPALAQIFDSGLDLEKILLAVQAESGTKVIPGETLVIFDEIQEAPKALTSLKYFAENLPELHIAAAGSLLGLTLHQGTGFPVGKVKIYDLFPLSFTEFLLATGQDSLLEILHSNSWDLISSFSQKLIEQLKQYFYIGGMPEVVSVFIETASLQEVRATQQQILRDYRFDISKHIPASDVENALAVIDSIPAHLGRENKKFIFSQVREGARARQFHNSITWLERAGLVQLVPRISKVGTPLKSYANQNQFKLFLLDIGLLSALSDLPASAVLGTDKMFTEFKGALTEQFVCQQLVSEFNLTPYYWSATNADSEIDFIIQTEGLIHPIEVKAAENLKSKSLRIFAEKHPINSPLRFSLADYRQQSWMSNIPLYAIIAGVDIF